MEGQWYVNDETYNQITESKVVFVVGCPFCDHPVTLITFNEMLTKEEVEKFLNWSLENKPGFAIGQVGKVFPILENEIRRPSL